MASSMFESILGLVTPEMKQSLAARFGESPQALQSGLGASAAATLSGLANNAGDPSFSDQAMQMISRAGNQNLLASLSSVAANGPSGVTGDLVNRFSSLVFGSRENQIAALVSQHAGLSLTSGSGILKMAAPLVLGYLARMHTSGSLNTANFTSSLRSEAANLGSYVPGGFLNRVTSVVGETANRTTATGVAPSASDTATRAARDTEMRARSIGRSRWAVPVAILGVLLLGWLVVRSMHTNQPNEVASTAVGTAPATPASWASLGGPIDVKLPDGTGLNVPSNGMEVKLITYLRSNAAPAGAPSGFDFDRLLFTSGQSSLEPISNEQLNNIAAILRAYPTARIALGGYTDNKGDPASNRKLSDERANVVMTELTRRGVDPARLSAKGYGEANPVADNSTEAGRAANRRVSIRVAEK